MAELHSCSRKAPACFVWILRSVLTSCLILLDPRGWQFTCLFPVSLAIASFCFVLFFSSASPQTHFILVRHTQNYPSYTPSHHCATKSQDVFIMKKIELTSHPINITAPENPLTQHWWHFLCPWTWLPISPVSGSGVRQCLFCGWLISLSMGIFSDVEKQLLEGRILEVNTMKTSDQ